MSAREDLFADVARALEPFAALAEQMYGSRDGELLYGRTTNASGFFQITVGDLREARAALLRLRREAE